MISEARKRIDWSLIRLLLIGGLIGLVIGAVGAVIDSQEHPGRVASVSGSPSL